MARERIIKPDFFTHPDLGELPAHARLLFAGLWCLADREGRLPDKPKVIKLAVLPWDDVDVDDLLAQLACAGFIQRYQAGDHALIQVENFRRHQRPHPREMRSKLPGPPSESEPNSGPKSYQPQEQREVSRPDDASNASAASNGKHNGHVIAPAVREDSLPSPSGSSDLSDLSGASDLPPIAPRPTAPGGESVSLPRFAKRRRGTQTLAEQKRDQRERRRDALSRLLDAERQRLCAPVWDPEQQAEISQAPPPREQLVAWLQERHGATAPEAEDAMRIVEAVLSVTEEISQNQDVAHGGGHA